MTTLPAQPAPVPPPGVWRACDLDQGPGPCLPSGHAALDQALPGGGWPLGALIELLQTPHGHHEWRLLAPALALLHAQRSVMLVGCPHHPHLPALTTLGLVPERLIWVSTPSPAERLWVAEQALGCRDLAAVLLWMPHVRPDALRRLHGAAQVRHGQDDPPKLLMLMRPMEAAQQASPAPLRLGVGIAAGHQLEVHLLKRRGPPLPQPLTLSARLPLMTGLLGQRAARPERSAQIVALPHSHVVDRPETAPKRRAA